MGDFKAMRSKVGQAGDEYEALVEEILKAHQEWQTIQNLFNEATSMDQIDYMIYMLEATEKRYDMLLKKAKEIHAAMVTDGYEEGKNITKGGNQG